MNTHNPAFGFEEVQRGHRRKHRGRRAGAASLEDQSRSTMVSILYAPTCQTILYYTV